MTKSTEPLGRALRTLYTLQPTALPPQDRDKLYASILGSGQLGTEYLIMLVLAGLIALFGLLQNSVAVIIGAMLISPLMNPILAAALALLLGDGSLGRKSAIILAVSVGGVIAITCLVAWLSPLKQATPEILARANPNLLDLFIAFMSGSAGTLALRGSNSSLTIIPGVAIAVAVVPPLAVVGYGLSVGQASLAGGAFLLFVTNLVAIIISAALVFWRMGFHPHEKSEEGWKGLFYRMVFSAGILVVLSIPLIQTLRRAVTQFHLRAQIQHTLDNAFRTEHSSVSEMSFSQAGEALRVHATLRTTRYFETSKIDAAQESLRILLGPQTRLDTDQILVTQGGISPQAAGRGDNAISGGVVRPAPKPPPFSFKASSGEILADLQKHIDELLAGTPIQRNGGAGVEISATPPLSVTVNLAAPEPLDAQSITLLSSQLSTQLSSPVLLHGQVSLRGPLYQGYWESPATQMRLAPEERQKLVQLAKLVSQRADLLLDISYVPASGEKKRTPWPPLLREIQRALAAGRLKPSQWSIHPGAEAKPAAVEAPPPESITGKSAASAVVVRYEFKTYQRF